MTIARGDTVVIHSSNRNGGDERWNGFHAEVVEIETVTNQALLRPLGPRPDKYECPFYWPLNELQAQKGRRDQSQ